MTSRPSFRTHHATPVRRVMAKQYVAALLLPLVFLASPSPALEVVPGSLSVWRSVDLGVSWTPISCAGGPVVFKGDLIRVDMSLRNNTGLLGPGYADYSIPAGWECGFAPGYICPPTPGDTGASAATLSKLAVSEADWRAGQWPSQVWVWPKLGPPPCVVSPDGPCPNLPYPDRLTSPVSYATTIYSPLMSVTVFDYNGEYYATVEEYDPGAGSWSAKAPMITPRSQFGFAGDGSGNLYAIGGWNEGGLVAAVEQYDPATGPLGTWTAKSNSGFTPRRDLSLVALGGMLYAIGGRDGTGALATVEVYDPGLDTWSATGSLNTARFGAMAAVSPVTGRIYVFGGLDSAGTPLSTIEEYDGVGSWTVYHDTLIDGLAGRAFGAVMVNPVTNHLQFVGGYAGEPAMGGNGMRQEVWGFDPTGPVSYPLSWLPGPFFGFLGRGYFGMEGDGSGLFYAIGGRYGDDGSNTGDTLMHYGALPDPALFGANGEDLVYDSSIDGWSPMGASMPTSRGDLGVGGSGGKIYAVGGYSGQRRAATATPDVAHVSWVFRAEREWPSLDFTVLMMESDDAFDWTIFSPIPFTPPSEGSAFDCGTCGPLTGSDGTNDDLFATNCGGTIKLESPIKIGAEAVPVTGTRPPQTVYVGDTFEVRVSATNFGAPVTINSLDACTDIFPTGTLCFFPQGLQGSCPPGATNPTAPALPFSFPAASQADFVWTYSVAGQGGASPCSQAGIGSGTAYFAVSFFGAGGYATVYVVPPPLSIAATVFVDPDGVAGGSYGWSPLGVTGPLGDRAGPYYFQGREELQVAFIYTNTSPTYSFDIAPVLDAGIYGPMLQISAPVVAGSLMLAPGASTTVTWVVARDPLGGLQNCQAHDAGEPEIIGVLGFNTVVRGLQGNAIVEMRDHPFHPTPFDPGNDCPGGCPAGTRNLTFKVPSTQSVGDSFVTSLTAKSTAVRPFVLDPSATLWMEAVGVSGSVTMTGRPAPGVLTWNPGESITFSWTFTALASGRVCYTAGIDFWSAAPPCHLACRDGAAYCAPRSPAYPPDPAGCELLILVPGILQVSSFTAAPPLACDEGAALTTVAITIRNTSTVFCGQVDQICNTAPEGYAAGQPLLGSYAGYVSGPFPVLPWTIPVGGEVTVTYYMDAVCPAPSGGWLEFGCLAKSGLVYGKAVDCTWGTVVNPNDVPSWSPSAPVRITAPAALWCSAWTDNDRYSVGQTITVYMTLENQGGDDLTGFGAAVYAKGALGGAVAPMLGPNPPVPWTYTGTGVCMPDPAFPPFPSSQTFVWTFQALNRGKIVFTATAQGWDAGCGNFKWTNCLMPEIMIADEAKLSVSAYASGLITMSVSCTGCPPQSGCNPATGAGCVEVALKASNFGGVDVSCFEVPDGDPANTFQPCAGCATAFVMPVPACSTAGQAACGDCIPCAAQGCDGAPGCQAAAPLAPPMCSATALWNPGQYPGCPGTVLQAGDTREYRWRYAPLGLGCFRANLWAQGNDDATCEGLRAADGIPVGILEGSGTTNCIRVLARYPLEMSLVSAPAQIAPGQEFLVQVRICNPGETAGGLQGGEPALQFYEIGTGAKITEQFDVVPPPAGVLPAGGCQVIEVRVTAHKNAAPGGVEIRVPEGALFIATDAETGQPFAARDTGSALIVTVINPANRFVVLGDNQTRILKQPVMFSYQVAEAGTAGGRTTLKIYTLSGELVRTLVDKPAAVEDVTVMWDGRNEQGQTVAGGVYLARLEAPSMKDGKVVKVPILK